MFGFRHIRICGPYYKMALKNCDNILYHFSLKPRDIIRRPLHLSCVVLRKKNILSDPLPVRLPTADVKILLLDEDGNSMGVFPKVEAARISRDKNLRLVRVDEFATLKESLNRTSVHPMYHLMQGTKLHELQMRDHEERKEAKKTVQKTLQLTTNATDHDIDVKIRAAEGWLKKGDSVKVLILGRLDSGSRLGDVHQNVMTKLKPYYKSTISGLSKSERNISFLLDSSVTQEAKTPEKDSKTDTPPTGSALPNEPANKPDP